MADEENKGVKPAEGAGNAAPPTAQYTPAPEGEKTPEQIEAEKKAAADEADKQKAEEEAEEIWNDTHGCPDCGPENDYGYRSINPACKTCKGEGMII